MRRQHRRPEIFTALFTASQCLATSITCIVAGTRPVMRARNVGTAIRWRCLRRIQSVRRRSTSARAVNCVMKRAASSRA